MKAPSVLIAGALVVFPTVLLRAGPAEVALPSPHVRAATPAVKTLLAAAVARSAIVSDLINRLTGSDTIVYVELTASPDIRVGRTRLVAAAAGARFVRIELSMRLPPWERLPYLAHELQHAVEIAETADVRDEAGVRRHFSRVGFASGIGQYETRAARDVESRVRAEIARAPR